MPVSGAARASDAARGGSGKAVASAAAHEIGSRSLGFDSRGRRRRRRSTGKGKSWMLITMYHRTRDITILLDLLTLVWLVWAVACIPRGLSLPCLLASNSLSFVILQPLHQELYNKHPSF